MKSIAVLGALALLVAAIVAPAQAKSPKPKPASPKPKCVAHAVSYQVSGTLSAAGALTANSDGTYSGSLTVLVTKTNDHAKTDKHTTRSYALSNAHVSFGQGVSTTAPAAGSRVNLHGTITTEPKKCGAFAPTITITKAGLRSAKK